MLAVLNPRSPHAARRGLDRAPEALIRLYQRGREEAIREHLLARFAPMIQVIARRCARAGAAIEDLVQEGRIGLLAAIDHYDETKGARFSTYAARRISSAIEHYVRDHAEVVRRPAWIQERAYRIRRETDRLGARLGRDPVPADVARSLEISEEQVREAIRLDAQCDLRSLDEPIDDDGSVSLLDTIPALPSASGLGVGCATRVLTDEERAVIDSLYGQQLTQREAARRLGIPLPLLRRLHGSAISRLRQEMTGEAGPAE